MKNALVGFIVFAVLAIGGVSAYYFFAGNGAEGLSLEFGKPDRVFVGEPFALAVSLSNSSDRILGDATIALELPDGVVFAGAGNDARVGEESIGDVGPGSIAKREFTLIALKDPQSLKRIEARVRYKTGGRTAFEYADTTDLAVGAPAVDLSFSAPDVVFSGEQMEVVIRYANNSSREVKNLRLALGYPPVFQFQRSVPDPSGSGNREWDLGTLTPGENGEVRVTGSAVGPEGLSFAFGATLRTDALGARYDIRTESVNVALSASPLALAIQANGEQNAIVRPGDEISYTLRYKNNSGVTLENVTLQAVLAGDMFNFFSLRTAGAFDSLRNTIRWNAAAMSDLAALPAGGEGEVEFSIDAKGAFPIRRLSDKNFTLKVRGEIESRTVPPGMQAAKTLSVANLETRVAGGASLEAKGYFRDAAAGIVNNGPFPPRVNLPTQYTIHWVVKNSATDVSDVKVSSFLQSGARFTGVVKSSIDAKPTYRSDTGEVVWNIGRIQAGVGLVTGPIEAVFQIEVTPAVNQAGRILPFIDRSTLTGMDLFVTAPFTSTAERITTELPDDPTVEGGETAVQP